MLDISKASLKELLGIATRAEIDANKIYSDIANSEYALAQEFEDYAEKNIDKVVT